MIAPRGSSRDCTRLPGQSNLKKRFADAIFSEVQFDPKELNRVTLYELDLNSGRDFEPREEFSLVADSPIVATDRIPDDEQTHADLDNKDDRSNVRKPKIEFAPRMRVGIGVRGYTTENKIIDEFLGRIEKIFGDNAVVLLQSRSDGAEFIGERPLTDFQQLELSEGDYFSCKIIESDSGTVSVSIGEAFSETVPPTFIEKLDEELMQLYPDEDDA